MDTVRLARDLGDVSGLLPTGISRLRDVPMAFLQAVKAALIFLSFEELPAEEMPPRSLWTDTDALNDHFAEMRRRRKSKYDGGADDDEKPAARNAALSMLIAG